MSAKPYLLVAKKPEPLYLGATTMTGTPVHSHGAEPLTMGGTPVWELFTPHFKAAAAEVESDYLALVEFAVIVKQDQFISATAVGEWNRYEGRDADEEDAYSHCGDGCCYVGPSPELMFLRHRRGQTNLHDMLPERDDVVTEIEVTAYAHQHPAATFQLAHHWLPAKGEPTLPPGTQLTRPLYVAEDMDRRGRVNRGWTGAK